MNVTCPACDTTYRVDPAKVPSGGVRARCTECGEVIDVRVARADGGADRGAEAPTREADGEAPAGAVAAQEGTSDAPRPDPGAQVVAAPGDGFSGSPSSGGSGEDRAGTAPATAAAPRSDAADAADARRGTEGAGQMPAAPAARPAPAFGATDPDAKARRLARALISDIVVYHPERRERSIAAGSLRQEFREEIQKSWEEYVAQVGDATARGTTHFRDALNEILAGGKRVF